MGPITNRIDILIKVHDSTLLCQECFLRGNVDLYVCMYIHLPHISIAPPRTKWRPKVSCKSINKIYITKHQHLQVSLLLGVFGQKLIANSFSL